MNRVVGGKISKSKKLYGGGNAEEFSNDIQEFMEDGKYIYQIDSDDISDDYRHDLIFKFEKEDIDTIIRLLEEEKSPEEMLSDLEESEVETNLFNLILNNRPAIQKIPFIVSFVEIAILLINSYNDQYGAYQKFDSTDILQRYAEDGQLVLNNYIERLSGEFDDGVEVDDPSSRPASRRSSRVSLASNPTSRRPSIASIIQSRPASRRPSRVIPDTDPEGVSESIYGPDDPRPVGYGKNKNKKSSINKKTMSERIVGAGKKMSAMEKKLMGMGMSGGQIKKLMKMGMSGAGVLSIQHGGRKMKKIMEEEEEEMSEEEEEVMPKMKGGRVAIDPFFGVISSEGGAMNFAHPEAFNDRRPMSKLAFGSGYSDKHNKMAIMEDKALEMKEAVRRAGTEGRRELDRKMSAPVMSYGGAKGEMEGGFFGSLLSAAIPLIGSLFGRGMMTKEAHDELMKTMKMKEKKGGMKHGAGMLNIQHGGAKKLLGQTRKDKEDEKLGMEMEGVKKKLGEGMSGGRKPNAFIAFSNKHRAKVRAQMKDAPMKEVMKKLGEMYRAQK